jgi:hypothetical protein
MKDANVEILNSNHLELGPHGPWDKGRSRMKRLNVTHKMITTFIKQEEESDEAVAYNRAVFGTQT